MEFEINGTVYEFPDGMGNEEVKAILRRKGVIPMEAPGATGASIGPGGGGAPFDVNPAEALDRGMQALGFDQGVRTAPTLEEQPFGDRDVAQIGKGLVKTAATAAAPFAGPSVEAAGAGLPALAGGLARLGVTGGGSAASAWLLEKLGRIAGGAVGAPETGSMLGETTGAVAGGAAADRAGRPFGAAVERLGDAAASTAGAVTSRLGTRAGRMQLTDEVIRADAPGAGVLRLKRALERLAGRGPGAERAAERAAAREVSATAKAEEKMTAKQLRAIIEDRARTRAAEDAAAAERASAAEARRKQDADVLKRHIAGQKEVGEKLRQGQEKDFQVRGSEMARDTEESLAAQFDRSEKMKKEQLRGTVEDRARSRAADAESEAETARAAIADKKREAAARKAAEKLQRAEEKAQQRARAEGESRAADFEDDLAEGKAEARVRSELAEDPKPKKSDKAAKQAAFDAKKKASREAGVDLSALDDTQREGVLATLVEVQAASKRGDVAAARAALEEANRKYKLKLNLQQLLKGKK